MIKYLILLITLSTCVTARLGETKSECIKRYGKPVNTLQNGKLLVFKVRGWYISTQFLKTTCDSIVYILPKNSTFSFRAIVDALKKNTSIPIYEFNYFKSNAWVSKNGEILLQCTRSKTGSKSILIAKVKK